MKSRRRPRLGLIICLQHLGLLAGIGPGQAQSDGAAKKYPPYSSVWDWLIPGGGTPESALSVEKQDNGDVLVTYALKNPKMQPGQSGCQPGITGCLASYGVTFFSRESAAPSASQQWLHGGTTIHLKNGFTFERIGSWGARRGCYGDLNATILKKDLSGNVVGRRKLLYVLDLPQRYKTRGDCDDGPSFVNRVDSVFADFLALEDDTFLMIDHQHGVIVRFDAEFRSQSALLNRRLFAVDEPLFNDWLRHMNYGSRADLNLNLRVQQDGLYKSLMEFKRRIQP